MDAFRFYSVNSLNFLYLLPFFVIFLFYAHKDREKAIAKFGVSSTVKKLIITTSPRRVNIKNAIMLVSVVLLLFSAARPQIGTEEEYVKRRGLDVFICLDISKSMLAEDIKPSRIIKAKHEIEKFISLLRGDRIGIILFAGESIVQCPLTLDYSAAKLFLEVADTTMASKGGTAIAQAIKMATKSYVQSEKKHKVMLIFTDGEDNQGKAAEAAEAAAKEGIVIFTIGMGTAKGEPIPLKTKDGRTYKKDEDGNVVMSKLNSNTLRTISRKTGGEYYNSTGSEKELEEIYKKIDQMEKKELASKYFTQFAERFQYPLGLALLALFCELVTSERVGARKEWGGRFE